MFVLAPKRFAKFGWQTRTFCHKKVGKAIAKLQSIYGAGKGSDLAVIQCLINVSAEKYIPLIRNAIGTAC